jgi:uncharacterized protein (DUF488 family)
MPSSSPAKPLTLYTVGHSTRSIEAFVELLHAFRVKQLVDVRTIPRSRHNPQFNSDQLSATLKAAAIHYVHMPQLGGLRHAHRDSPNTGWRNASFRGFADYMQQPEFQSGLDKLLKLARLRRTAIMCAEAVPWRCHRLLIADALLVRGVHGEHILSGKRAEAHTLTPFAQVKGLQITYPGEGNLFQEQE